MKKILKSGINSNMLKTIAIIAMVIDHIGFYFVDAIPTSIYTTCRYIGRIAMPIFVYLLVQGFFHTKSFKKYITRIGIFALITQALITLCMFINIKYIPGYIAAKQVYLNGNILFSFVISLGVLKILFEDIIIKKWTKNANVILKVILVIILGLIAIIIPLDYGKEVFVLGMLLYYIERLKIQVFMSKNNPNNNLKNIVLNTISDEKVNLAYILLVFMALSMIVIYFNNSWIVLLSIIPIALYNGKRGKISMKYIYYIIFTLQHILLYSLAMVLTLT